MDPRGIVVKQLIRAAQRGSASEQFNLGVLYESGVDDNGYSMTPNYEEAIVWLKRAAQQGLPRAQIKLAKLYAYRNLPQDDIRACAWLLVASNALGGIHRDAAHLGYKDIASRLSPEDLKEVHRLALAFKKNCHSEAAAYPAN
jgi:TPR repeat protein